MQLLRDEAASLGITLSPSQLRQFQQHYEALVQWNRQVNLTSLTGWEEVQRYHFLDSLTVALALSKETLERGRVLDVGTGAGFPGLPLKLAFPGITLVLMEATAKKTAFLDHVVQLLGLERVDVCTGRAEELAHRPGLREGFDAVLSRAVARMHVLAELTVPFARLGGLVVTQKKGAFQEELAQAGPALEVLGGILKEVRWIQREALGEPRALVVVEKVASTPQGYPRRPGIPKKRPIAGAGALSVPPPAQAKRHLADDRGGSSRRPRAQAKTSRPRFKPIMT